MENDLNAYQYNAQIKKVKDLANKNPGEGGLSPEAIKDTLESLEIPRNEKLDNAASWVEENEMWIDHYQKKIKQYTAEVKRRTDQNKRLNAFIADVILDAGYKSITTDKYVLRTRASNVTVIDDETLIPDHFFKIPEQKPKVNKFEIKKALKAGEKVPGAHLGENHSLTII